MKCISHCRLPRGSVLGGHSSTIYSVQDAPRLKNHGQQTWSKHESPRQLMTAWMNEWERNKSIQDENVSVFMLHYFMWSHRSVKYDTVIPESIFYSTGIKFLSDTLGGLLYGITSPLTATFYLKHSAVNAAHSIHLKPFPSRHFCISPFLMITHILLFSGTEP